jgi:hypothetical protein
MIRLLFEAEISMHSAALRLRVSVIETDMSD